MEISLVRKRLRDSIEDAQKNAIARRAANQEATEAWEQVLERVVTPLLQQVSQVLKSEGYAFRVITPAGTVRLDIRTLRRRLHRGRDGHLRPGARGRGAGEPHARPRAVQRRAHRRIR